MRTTASLGIITWARLVALGVVDQCALCRVLVTTVAVRRVRSSHGEPGRSAGRAAKALGVELIGAIQRQFADGRVAAMNGLNTLDGVLGGRLLGASEDGDGERQEAKNGLHCVNYYDCFLTFDLDVGKNQSD